MELIHNMDMDRVMTSDTTSDTDSDTDILRARVSAHLWQQSLNESGNRNFRFENRLELLISDWPLYHINLLTPTCIHLSELWAPKWF